MSDLLYGAEAAAQLGALIDRDGLRESDEINARVPYPKQTEFETSEHRLVCMIGANRTGKTKGLARRIARRVRSGKAKLVWIVCPSFAMFRQNLMPILFGDPANSTVKPMIPPNEVAETREKPDWEYVGKDGWRIVVKSCEQGAEKFAGAAVDDIYFDEPPTWPVWNECQIRFAAGKPCLIRLAATLLPPPGQAGGICQWLWSEMIEPWLNHKAPHDVKIVNVGMADNPHITPDQLALARRLYPIGSLDRRIRVDGELMPGLAGARCYVAFDRRLHVNKFLARKDVDPLKPTYLSCDFNVEPLCWGILQKHGRVWRKLDEITLRPGTIDAAADEVIKRYATVLRNTLFICGDATSERRTAQTGKTDYDLLCAKLKDHFRIQLLLPEKNPPERDRVNLFNFIMGGNGNEIQYEVSAECTESIADYEQVLWSKDGSHIRKAHDASDPYYQRTHHSDGDGYVIFMREQHVLLKARRVDDNRPGTIPTPSYGFVQ